MAETNASKAKSKQRKSAKRASRPAAKSNAKRRTSRPKSKSQSSRARPAKSKVAQLTSGAQEGVEDAGQTVADAGKKAGKVAGEAVSKAKVPLLAGGAALVGAAGGLALSRSTGVGKAIGAKPRRVKVKIDTKDLARTADRVASAGEQIGRLSTGVRQIPGVAQENGHRSPIEVLIQGLTRRR